MTPAARILDKLARPRQNRPGAWSAACPVCESRKGRPLAITEKDDGRVLIHAFCGCSTEDVLGRIGLTINDLFEKPLAAHAAPAAARIPAGEVLAALSTEATTLALIASDMLGGTPPDWQRLSDCARRINHARDYINEKAR
jgi:hypothetical protein